ncbi:transposase [Psychrobacillus sp. PGGUH221]|uniref:transposase n=1 Tax=Psychrobacillus sp. PGGUH221 TaxID=3020058 RepID=UPI0035C6EFAF
MYKKIYFDFPDDDCYKKYLLNLRWKGKITCPFCGSHRNTRIRSTFRFHCNLCNTTYSLTAKTVMHNTKVELRKWLLTLYLYLNNEKLSYRKLTKLINVNKNTAYRMVNGIQLLFSRHRLLILKISGLKKDVIEIMSLMLLIDTRRS